MAEIREILSKPPVKEALVDIRFSQLFSIEQIDLLATQVRNDFVKASPIWMTQLGLNVNADRAHQDERSSAEKIGMRFDAGNGEHVLQYRNNG